MTTEYSYPTDEQLAFITEWNILEKPVGDLVEYIRALWWAPDWGFVVTGKRVRKLELHTGGWSGNESIMAALQANRHFWSWCWVKSTRGGHFWFSIKPIREEQWRKP